MKPYKKGIKLIVFISLLFFFTLYFARKADTLAININENVRTSLLVDKGYSSVSISKSRRLTKAEINRFKELLHIQPTKMNDVLIVDHKFRINDTLYSVQVFINKNNEVISLDQPKKVWKIER